MKISVVIPYYQEAPGILARALKSIFEQQLDAGVMLDVIVVNDTSPLDPAVDIAAVGAPPSQIAIRVIPRPNGGPAAARNTGFDAVPADAGYMAMLDSDDTWSPNHIARAIEGFRLSNADVYFSDHASHHHAAYLDGTKMFTDPLVSPGALEPLAGDRYFVASGHYMASSAAREFLAHSSTVLCRASMLRDGLRMPEKLRWAGEDHNFFIDMTLKADKVCLSMHSEAALGRGVSIYEGAHEWGSLKDLRRRAYNVAAVRRVQNRSNWPRAIRADLAEGVAAGRRIVGYLLMRRILRPRGPDMEAVRLVWSIDRQTVVCAPFSVIDVFARKVLRKAGLKVAP